MTRAPDVPILETGAFAAPRPAPGTACGVHTLRALDDPVPHFAFDGAG